MIENSVGKMISSQPPEQSKLDGRVLRWALILVLLGAGLGLMVFLVWGATSDALGLSKIDHPDWMYDSPLVAVVGTPTPTPVPTPTLTPGQVAAQFVPQMRGALAGEDWERAAELVTIMGAVDPTGEEVRQWAFTMHMQQGQALVGAGEESQADLQFDQAVELAPEDAEALLWQQTTKAYLIGEDALAASQWDPAIESFTLAYEQMPDYGDLFPRLIESYRRKGQAAIEAEDWPTAIETLLEARERVPDDADMAALLSAAYQGQARAAMAGEDWSSAIATLTEARQELPDDTEVVEFLSRAYRGAGQAALAEEQWNAAIKILSEAQEQLPDDAKITDVLATAYRDRGIAREEALELQDAKADFRAALELRPNDEKATKHLERVRYLLSKRIVIDISQQRLYAYQGDQLVYKYPVSTGLRGRDTSTGSFHIQSKIPMAYSRIWKLKMPYWMGVYWVQGIENGIHALPIRPNGTVMWGGLLGQRASYGCIILSNSAAKKIYNWVDLGTPVKIRQ